MTSVVCGDNGELIALNDTNKTWYRLKSRTRLATSSPLFNYFGATVSKLKVTSDPDGHVKFSYRLDFVTGGEHVSGEVWGEIKVTTADAPHKSALPWNPTDITTGYPRSMTSCAARWRLMATWRRPKRPSRGASRTGRR